MPKIKEVTGVTEDRKQAVIDSFYADGVTDVQSEKENGT